MEDTKGARPESAAVDASGPVKDLSTFVSEAHRKPGELGFAAFGFIIGALGYYFALDMTSGEYSSPSVFPKLASTIIMVCSAVNFLRTLRRERPEASAPSLAKFLLPGDVVVVLVLLTAYCILLPRLHFIASSFAFLVAGMVYLQRGKNVIRAIVISAASLAVLVAIFRYLFLVILP